MPDGMNLGEALDHVRAWHSRNVKPFEKLAEVLEYARQLDGQVQEAELRLSRLQAEYFDQEVRQRTARDLLADEIKDAERRLASLKPAAADADKAVLMAQNKTDQAERKYVARLAELEEGLQLRHKELEKEFQARALELEKEINALAAKKAEYEAWKKGLA